MNFYLEWLKVNAGKYEIWPDNSVWKLVDGTELINKFSMSYKGTCISFTAVIGLEGCIDTFIDIENKGLIK